MTRPDEDFPADASDIIERAAELGFDADRVRDALGYRPEVGTSEDVNVTPLPTSEI